jgi:ELWxxDGT repeat protein
VKEIVSGNCTYCLQSASFLSWNGNVYIVGSMLGALWRTDGTTAGTFIVDQAALVEQPAAAFSRLYYFKRGNPGSWAEWWSTDGTAAGSVKVMDLPTLGYAAGPGRFLGGALYFPFSDRHYGNEPWISEAGTAATTHLIANMRPDVAGSSNPGSFIAAGDQVFFIAQDDASTELWRSDGTSAGTRQLTSLNPPLTCCTVPSEMTAFHGALYFRPSYSATAVWKSDGSLATLFKDFQLPFSTPAATIAATSSILWINAHDQNDKPTLWKSDGTPAGTIALRKPGTLTPAGGGQFVESSGTVFFFSGNELWRTEGTPESTRSTWVLPSGASNTSQPVAARGLLFFTMTTTAEGNELWASDGTQEGTRLVKDIVPGANNSSPKLLTPAGDYVFFTATDADHGLELWRTDGTAAGTIPVKDIREGTLSSSPANLTAAGGVLFFTADDGVHGVELWRTDGTPEGTTLVRDIAPDAASSTPSSLVFAQGLLWFSATEATNGAELWQSDGTSAGTILAADIAAGSASSAPSGMTRAGRRLYFAATEAFGRELYALDLADVATFAITGGRVVEGNSGTRTIRFTVTRTGNSSAALNVAYATADLTAAAGSDYVAQSGTLAFGSGVTSQSIDVVVNADLAIEADESFAVVLSPAVNALLDVDRAAGVIEDDDHRAELSITLDTGRVLTVTNAGPSTATNVQVRFNESPGVVFYSCTTDPCVRNIGTLTPGQSQVIYATPSIGSTPLFDPSKPVGYRFTASVSALESDTNPADNSVTALFGAAVMITPPFLTVGQSGTARFSNTSYKTVSITSAAPSIVAVTPGTIDDPAGLSNAVFTLQAGSTPGIAKLTVGVPKFTLGQVPVEVVPVGQVGKLDVGVYSPPPFSTENNTPIHVPVEMAGSLPDGTPPSGTVTLLDANLQPVAQGQLDATGSAVLTRPGVPQGRYAQTIDYSGDAYFRSARIPYVEIIVGGYDTVTTFTLTRTSCRMAEGYVTVKAPSATSAPTGTVRMTINSTDVQVTLTPTGAPGESRGVLRINLPQTSNSVHGYYVGNSDFKQSWADAQYIDASSCDGFGTSLYIVTPCRVLDTRDSTAIVQGSIRTAAIAGRCGIPMSAKAVIINVTAVSPVSTGFLALAPSGLQPFPATSTINYRAKKTRANNAVVALPSDGKVDIRNGGDAAIHTIIDVTGYFQ